MWFIAEGVPYEFPENPSEILCQKVFILMSAALDLNAVQISTEWYFCIFETYSKNYSKPVSGDFEITAAFYAIDECRWIYFIRLKRAVHDIILVRTMSTTIYLRAIANISNNHLITKASINDLNSCFQNNIPGNALSMLQMNQSLYSKFFVGLFGASINFKTHFRG